jgi:Holliday junction DNA helicase RuvA
MIASITGRVAAKSADRVVIETAGGVGYEVTVPLGVMEKLPAVGERVTLATELVVREDAQFLFGFLTETEKRFFQRLLGVSGVGPRTALALISTLGVERGSRAIKARDIATLASVSGIGKKTAERLALELADKMGELGEGAAAAPVAGPAEAAVRALERLGYSPAEADKAVRQVLAGDGGIASDSAALVRRALEVLTAR